MAMEHEEFRSRLFRDREEAGRLLADRLEAFRGPDVLVLGIPRGGVVPAAEVARRLDTELDVIVARKLGAPGTGELAIGAVTADGGRFLNHETIHLLEVSPLYVEAATHRERLEARRREARFRRGRPELRVAGRIVIVVDDGLATGATVRAAVQSLGRRQPGRLIVAAPVGSREACAALRQEADEVVCPYEPEYFGAVGSFYERFEPVEDEEVERLLAAAHPVGSVP